MALYAEGTTVTPESSQAEIQKLLVRYKATGYMTAWQGSRALIAFMMEGKQIRMEIELPTDPAEFARTAHKRYRDARQQQLAMAAEIRRRWRSLAFVMKAKLESVATGITTIEQEFGMHLVLPDGRTLSEHVLPKVREAIETHRMPTTLLAIGGRVDEQ